MKKNLIILANVLIVLGILAFVALYTRSGTRRDFEARTLAFEDMTVAMERVTTNYMVGEQRICDTWARYIDGASMTLEEAADFCHTAAVQSDSMAHIILTEEGGMMGVSSEPKVNAPEDFSVDYSKLDLFSDGAEPSDGDGMVNITRAYTNPINGVQSIAFYDPIRVMGESGPCQALLLRVVPISVLEREWVFPTDEYARAELSMIDAQGDYILKGRSFKNANFFEFYKSYNEVELAQLNELEARVLGTTGTQQMLNSRGEPCMVAYTPVNSATDWTILTYIPISELTRAQTDWVMIGAVSAGLLLLFVMDLFIMLHFNRRLAAMAEAAASASKAKTDFLSTMSHDIRTPMNAIIGLTTIAGRNVNDTENVRDCLKKINMASSHLLTLINDILDISKVESGQLTLSPVTFSIVESAENLVNLSQPMVKEKNIDFNFRISGMDREYLYADQLRINQIFINLLSNAIKYTGPGGRVSVDMREAPVDDGRVTLTYVVADTGMGMTPEFMARMYQPFSRQTDSRVNTIQGTGLGLAITKQMVELMDGEIDCQSQVGQGTTFTVTLTLPVADKQADERVIEPVDVLLVDDDEVLRTTAKETLEAIGTRPDVAASGGEAIEKVLERHARGEDYRVVILDWRMPDMDGVEVARRLRREVGDEVSILVISAYDWSDIENDARAAGVNGFVSKPLFRSTLCSKINEMLGAAVEDHAAEEDNSDVAGMNILVAEDNDVNWEIISMLLQMHGITCERAENGQLAVERMEAARPGEFDLIFMDIQMPVMNGLDATRAIRALKDEWASSIPIIAMTADAFSENVAECLAVGMNGHIAKPVDMKLVLKEIRRIREEALRA